MTTRQMIQENNRLREQMTPANRDFYEDILVHVRDSRANRQQGEERLLELAKEVLAAQKKGKSASKLFGGDAEAYARSVVESLPSAKPVEGTAYYIMIAWTALTILFLIEAVIGFGAQFAGYSSNSLNHISLLTLILVPVGSIVIMEVLMKSLGKSQEHENNKPGINVKAIGIYLIIMVIVVVIGFSLRNMLPVFTIQPWLSLVLCIIGFLGLRFIFLRKSK
ncbi:DUF1129 domain-containing protein [Paenibacillus sp. KQZ6P-2]|uniref:DUF1129 domain-containing protein n=1 Tax=Paenibacillus mangrovi TaxID=2931978 RepID=A0A9X2B6R4_9BACL|nr:DUF1129 family protein [Paenibacillus mangrovi]MCJ8014087.1 DUF1129 domain-containing protein [Paenibacillus mangrovi]